MHFRSPWRTSVWDTLTWPNSNKGSRRHAKSPYFAVLRAQFPFVFCIFVCICNKHYVEMSTKLLLRAAWRPAALKSSGDAHRAFSASAPRPLMATAGFTETQLTVRDAVKQVCTGFPSTYWREHDQQAKDPTEFHAA